MVERQPLLLPERSNYTWSMDFVMDSLANGRRIKCLTIVDDFSKECLDIPLGHGISGEQYPVAVRTDQGPEFTGKPLDQWVYQNGVELKLIQPGKPMQYGYIESFNGKFRHECLNEHWFTDLDHARKLINQGRIDYNENRPHFSLGYQTPLEFAAANQQVDSKITSINKLRLG